MGGARVDVYLVERALAGAIKKLGTNPASASCPAEVLASELVF